MSYSGSTSFRFEIERYRNKETGSLLPYQEFMDDAGSEYEYTIVSLFVEGQSYFTAGRYSGPPEDSYPDEGDTEIMSVTGPDEADWEDQLTDPEKESVLEDIKSRVQEQDY